jgi:uncharacterized lipoprotein NlpE involved in copper resistance
MQRHYRRTSNVISRAYLMALALAAGLATATAPLSVAQAAAPPAAADQFKSLATGTWRATVDDPSGAPIAMTLTLKADGTYTRVYTAAGGEAAPPATNGTWTVQPAADGKFSLTLVRAGQAAAEAKPVVFRVVDNDNLLNETENYRARRSP